ncbi:signal peptidase I [Candidatus Woesearchaeota archaeon]|nr:signal peptidase I [Candidatus Woesearchaeota archaeon]
MSFAKQLKRFWRYVWYGDSLGSLALNLILAFIIIRFLLYPFLGLILGTGFPIVAVVSGSMEHDGTFDQWWTSSCSSSPQASFYDQYGITKETFLDYRFAHGFNKGDIMVLAGAENVEIGEVIVFMSPRRSEPIIHRLIDNTNGTYRTKGDHNCAVAAFEQSIQPEQVVGKALFRIPWVGYIKIIFVELLALVGIGGGI